MFSYNGFNFTFLKKSSIKIDKLLLRKKNDRIKKNHVGDSSGNFI